VSAHEPEERRRTGGLGYETRDLRVRAIVYGAIVVAALAVFAHVGMWLLLEGLARRDNARAVAQRPLAAELRREAPPEPRLQTSPLKDLLALRAWEDRMLTTYAWVERDKGAVRIPLDHAMELVLQHGLPARKERTQ